MKTFLNPDTFVGGMAVAALWVLFFTFIIYGLYMSADLVMKSNECKLACANSLQNITDNYYCTPKNASLIFNFTR